MLKSGRTHLQDAMPIRLGQEFRAYGVTIDRNMQRIEMAATFHVEVTAGGPGVGTLQLTLLTPFLFVLPTEHVLVGQISTR